MQPQDLTASEITVRLGSTWIPPEYIKEFTFEATAPKSDNARLAAITVNGAPLEGFDADTTDYTLKLQYEENLERFCFYNVGQRQTACV